MQVSWMSILFGALLGVLGGVPSGDAQVSESTDSRIARYYYSVTGLTLRANELNQLRQEVVNVSGQLDESLLFSRLFDQKEFYDLRLSRFVSQMSNEEAEPYQDMDDFQISLLLGIASGIDIRDLFTKGYLIRSNESVANPSSWIAELARASYSMKPILEKYKLEFPRSWPSGDNVNPANGYYTEGIMTTQSFGKQFFFDGTNRRPVRAAYDLFLCSKISSWADPTLDDFYVGGDVSRNPSGHPEDYQGKCRSCHAPMDSQRPMGFKYDYVRGPFGMDGGVTVGTAKAKEKYNRNVTYSDYNPITDDSWENLLTTPPHMARFRWSGVVNGRLTGRGMLSFSSMIVNAGQFLTCTTQRLLSVFCEMDEGKIKGINKTPEFQRLEQAFAFSGYRVKPHIQNIVTSPLCQK